MRLLRKVKGKKVTIALFDNNMRLVIPVYDYLKERYTRNSEPNTVLANGEDLKTYWEYLDYKDVSYDAIDAVTVRKHISGFVVYLKTPFPDKQIVWDNSRMKRLPSRRSNRTINRILGTVYQFYKKQVGMIFDRDDFKVRDADEKDNFRILSYNEYEMILDALKSKRDKLLFKTLYWTGMRISEALSLTIADIPVPDSDESVAVIEVHEPKDAGRDQQFKSGKRQRPVYFPMWLVEELDDFIYEEREEIYIKGKKIDIKSEFLFISKQRDKKGNIGKVLTQNSVYQQYRKLAEKLKITTFSPHSLRHTCCTNLIAGWRKKNGDISKVPIEVVKNMMGHKNIATTMKYVHLSDEVMRTELSAYWAVSIYRGEQDHAVEGLTKRGR